MICAVHHERLVPSMYDAVESADCLALVSHLSFSLSLCCTPAEVSPFERSHDRGVHVVGIHFDKLLQFSTE